MFYLGSGDRTPKQKVKLKVTEEKLLNLMLKYNGGRPRSEVLTFPSSFSHFVLLYCQYSYLCNRLLDGAFVDDLFCRQNSRVLSSCKICWMPHGCLYHAQGITLYVKNCWFRCESMVSAASYANHFQANLHPLPTNGKIPPPPKKKKTKGKIFSRFWLAWIHDCYWCRLA